MKHLAILACVTLAACTSGTTSVSSGPDPATLMYAASAGLDQAEVAAAAYTTSPIADPTVKAQIKALDNTAYNAIHPILDAAAAGGSPVTAAEAEAAQAALGALTSYLTNHGVN